MKLKQSEQHLLQWLAKKDESQYGECYGPALDRLVKLGLAEVLGPESGRNNEFIAKGDGLMYRAVRLTETGLKADKQLPT